MSRRRPTEEHENHERWLVSYADFITLMFAFFTILYATAQRDVEKEKQFVESVRKYLAQSPGAGGGAGQSPAQIEARPPAIENIAPESKTDRAQVEQEIQQVLKEIRVKAVGSKGGEAPESGAEDLVRGMTHETNGVRIQLAASVIFPEGSTKMDVATLRQLDELGKVLKKLNRPIIVEGHTDNQPVVGGTYPSNWELASMRATKMVRFLIQRYDLDPSLLTATSYADQKPLAANSSEENRALNRRIEIFVVLDED